MEDSIIGSSMVLDGGQILDQEIDDLQTQVRRLKRTLKQHKTNILSSRYSDTLLTSNLSIDRSISSEATPLLHDSHLQAAHNTTTLYQTCASITTFKVIDPDPYAVDSGRVLGIRIESFNSGSGKYQRPYYVFLNKPWTGEGRDLLRVHRHTLPPSFNIATLAKRYLPGPKGTGREVELLKAGKQDLGLFVKALRREVVAQGNRVQVIREMRKKCGLEDKAKNMRVRSGVVDITAVDAEAKHVRFEWRNGQVGRVIMDGKGIIQKCVVVGPDGRDRRVERDLLGQRCSIEEMVETLPEARGNRT